MVIIGYKKFIIPTLSYQKIKICFREYKHIKSAMDAMQEFNRFYAYKTSII